LTRTLFLFRKYLEYLDNNLVSINSGEDAHKVVQFHQTDYLDEITEAIGHNEKRLNEILDFYSELNHYTDKKMSWLQQVNDEMDNMILNQTNNLKKFLNNVKLMGRYVSNSYKLKFKVSRFF